MCLHIDNFGTLEAPVHRGHGSMNRLSCLLLRHWKFPLSSRLLLNILCVTYTVHTILFDVNATMGLGGEFMVFYSRDSQIYFNRL